LKKKNFLFEKEKALRHNEVTQGFFDFIIPRIECGIQPEVS
jgi:hypothetical protein